MPLLRTNVFKDGVSEPTPETLPPITLAQKCPPKRDGGAGMNGGCPQKFLACLKSKNGLLALLGLLALAAMYYLYSNCKNGNSGNGKSGDGGQGSRELKSTLSRIQASHDAMVGSDANMNGGARGGRGGSAGSGIGGEGGGSTTGSSDCRGSRDAEMKRALEMNKRLCNAIKSLSKMEREACAKANELSENMQRLENEVRLANNERDILKAKLCVLVKKYSDRE